MRPHSTGGKRILFVDNCSGHNDSDSLRHARANVNTELMKFPPNTTGLLQPADSFVISKIKDAWKKRWDQYKAGLIMRGEWMGWSNGKSGKHINPGNRFFLQLAAAAVRDVNTQRDRNDRTGLTYARKAMIRTGLALNLKGLWEEKQLSYELQAIIAENSSCFDGEPVE